MVRNSLRSFRVISLAGLLALTLGLSGIASAHSSSQTAVVVPQQATATVIPIDPDVAVPLTFGQESMSPIDADQITNRTFSFKGKANQLVSITSKVLTGNLSLKVTLYTQGDAEIGYADGSFVTTITLTVKLPQDGNYKLNVRKAEPGAGDFTAGTFSVMVADAATTSTTSAASVPAATVSATAAATTSK